jgi:hypothetical protein
VGFYKINVNPIYVIHYLGLSKDHMIYQEAALGC